MGIRPIFAVACTEAPIVIVCDLSYFEDCARPPFPKNLVVLGKAEVTENRIIDHGRWIFGAYCPMHDPHHSRTRPYQQASARFSCASTSAIVMSCRHALQLLSGFSAGSRNTVHPTSPMQPL